MNIKNKFTGDSTSSNLLSETQKELLVSQVKIKGNNIARTCDSTTGSK